DERFDASPHRCREFHRSLPIDLEPAEVRVSVYDAAGAELVSYSPTVLNADFPDPAQAIAKPEEIDSNESLYLAGLHLEQYRHATRQSEDYFREALFRDPGDIRCNLA